MLPQVQVVAEVYLNAKLVCERGLLEKLSVFRVGGPTDELRPFARSSEAGYKSNCASVFLRKTRIQTLELADAVVFVL